MKPIAGNMRYKVLHVHALPVVSGSGINTFLTMRDVDRNRFESELACAPGGDLERLVRASGLKFHSFSNFVQPVDPMNDVAALIRLTRFLLKKRYHIVHTHNSKTGFIGRLAGRLARVPVVVHTVHGFSFHDYEAKWRRQLFKGLEKIAAGWCDRMIFISQPLIDWALKENIIPDQKKAVKIYSGIEIGQFKPSTAQEKLKNREKWGISESVPVIGIVSKLWEGKGHATLIDSFSTVRKKMRKGCLVIVGEGPVRGELEEMVRRKGLQGHVIFTGFQKDVAPVISMFDLSVLPSFFEGMGRVLLESMAMGVPVIGSRVGGIPDIIRHGKDGFLVPPGDKKALAAAILKILDETELATYMGMSGIDRVSEKFSARAMVRKIEAVYLDALAEKGIA
jgi:glycosyltransferase involved in cell wall biosynthesis